MSDSVISRYPSNPAEAVEKIDNALGTPNNANSIDVLQNAFVLPMHEDEAGEIVPSMDPVEFSTNAKVVGLQLERHVQYNGEHFITDMQRYVHALYTRSLADDRNKIYDAIIQDGHDNPALLGKFASAVDSIKKGDIFHDGALSDLQASEYMNAVASYGSPALSANVECQRMVANIARATTLPIEPTRLKPSVLEQERAKIDARTKAMIEGFKATAANTATGGLAPYINDILAADAQNLGDLLASIAKLSPDVMGALRQAVPKSAASPDQQKSLQDAMDKAIADLKSVPASEAYAKASVPASPSITGSAYVATFFNSGGVTSVVDATLGIPLPFLKTDSEAFKLTLGLQEEGRYGKDGKDAMGNLVPGFATHKWEASVALGLTPNLGPNVSAGLTLLGQIQRFNNTGENVAGKALDPEKAKAASNAAEHWESVISLNGFVSAKADTGWGARLSAFGGKFFEVSGQNIDRQWLFAELAAFREIGDSKKPGWSGKLELLYGVSQFKTQTGDTKPDGTKPAQIVQERTYLYGSGSVTHKFGGGQTFGAEAGVVVPLTHPDNPNGSNNRFRGLQDGPAANGQIKATF